MRFHNRFIEFRTSPLIIGLAFLKIKNYMTNTEFKIPEMTENFEDLLNEQFGDNGILGTVVKGTIVKISDDYVTVDVGLKSEGNIPMREFGTNPELKIGDAVEVLVDRYEDKDGNIVLSREKARREEAWADLEKSMNAGERVNVLSLVALKAALPLI